MVQDDISLVRGELRGSGYKDQNYFNFTTTAIYARDYTSVQSALPAICLGN